MVHRNMMESEMAHDIYTDRSVPTRSANPAMLVLIAALLGMVFWFGAQNIDAPTLPEADQTVPQAEDWHGNVKRSYGPY